MTAKGFLLDLGLRDYLEVWELQRNLAEQRAKKLILDTLILVQHPHIFTVGKAVQGEIPTEINGVPVLRVERGGQWTYHGLGQLVGYPILDLEARDRDIHSFLRNIEETLIMALAKFDIAAERREGQTGVWVERKKIASIGAAIRNWTSFHGFALNVNTDMSYFEMIEPCGMPSSTMTSMKTQLGRELDFDLVKTQVRNAFEVIFKLELADTTPYALSIIPAHNSLLP